MGSDRGGENRGGFGGGEQRGGYNRSENRGGFGGGENRRGGFGGGENRGNFGGGENRGSFGGGEQRGSFGGGENRRGGFGGGENRRGGFGGGENRRGGFGGGEQRGSFGGGENRGSFGEGEQRGGYNRSENRGGFGGGESRRGGFGGGERRTFNDDQRTGFSGGDRNNFGAQRSERDGNNEGGEPERRERYIPEEIEDNETNLFHNIATGVNFEKQSKIPANLSGSGTDDIKPIDSFAEAKLSDLLLENIKKSNYKTPTPVQRYAIPIILKKRDLMSCAQTGSGKTAAFVLPIMTNILQDGIGTSSLSSIQEPQALILSPTRELAIQTHLECRKFSYQSVIKSCILYGGADTGSQMRLIRGGCNILVATPGRLLDVVEKGWISLEKVKYFVLDEADRMLDMGFEIAVRDILKKGKISEKTDRHTFMFSATFPSEIQQLAQDFLNDYIFLTVGVLGGANQDVEQVVHKVTRFEKRDKVIDIINEIGNEKVMIFVESKKSADIVAFYLSQKGYPTTSLHGDRLQRQREEALKLFKTGACKIIVATAVAARGLDIEKVSYVINYDLPNTIDEYVHRIGRTGRCGNLGKAISFFDDQSDDDNKLARPLVRILTQAEQAIPSWLNEIAEGNYGTAYTGEGCTDDLRSNFNSMKINPAPMVSQAPQQADDDNWG
jgi:probable ATP-dependent RNA helicase DDX4